MKHLKIVPKKEMNKEWRFRWYHVLICCVLITVVLVSMSVGLGYARYMTETKPSTLSYTVNGRQLKFTGYVIAKRVPGVDTVLSSEDGRIKVTVPANATGEGLDNAEYLLLKVTNSAVNLNQYNKENQQHSISCSIQLQSYSNGVEVDNYPYVNDTTGRIGVELNVGHDAVDFVNVPDTAPVYDAENGLLKFTGINSITDQNGSFATAFDRAAITPDTSWFDASYDTFIINTPAELAGVAKLVKDRITDFSEKTIQLGSDISLYNQDNSKYTWEPIGNDNTPFKGSFDGAGHTISGLNLRVYENTTNDYDRTCGLFGEVSGDGNNTIENVTLKDVSYAADMGVYQGSDDGQAFGALAGYTFGVNVSDIHVDGLNVYGTAKYIGGIIGRGDRNGSVSDCSVQNAAFDPSGAGYVGGIVGLQFGNDQDTNISECYVSADINGSHSGVGGIVGNAYEDNGAVGVEKCYAIGNFEPTAGNGIVGTDTTSYMINNCLSQYDGGTWQTDAECWFTADMTYEQYLEAIREHGDGPVVPTEAATEAPTEASTEAPTEAPTVPEQYATEHYETPIH